MRGRITAAALAMAMMLTTPVLAAGTWSGPQVISGAEDFASFPRLTMSSDGQRLTSAWHFNDIGFTSSRVAANSSADFGRTWQPGGRTDLTEPDTLNEPAGLDASADGSRALAVWQVRSLSPGGPEGLHAARLQGGVWSAPALVTANGADVSNPQVHMSADGSRVTVVYSQDLGSELAIRAVSSTDGGATFSSPVTISAPGENAEQPLLAGSGDGRTLTAVWTTIPSPATSIRASHSTDGGRTWDSPETISAPDQFARQPDLFSTSDGAGAVAVWTQSPPNRRVASSTLSGGSWSDPVLVSAPELDAEEPVVRGAADGSSAVAAWTSPAAEQVLVAAGNGRTWGAPRFVSTQQSAYRPDLATSSDGRRVGLVWVSDQLAALTIKFALSNDAGSTWTPPEDLSAATTGADDPNIEASANGFRFAAAWAQFDGTTNQIATAAFLEPRPQTLDFAAPAPLVVGGPSSRLVATASSGLPVRFTTTTPNTCRIDGTDVVPVSAGACQLTAAQAGNEEFLPVDAARTVDVARAAQRVACTKTPPRRIKKRGKTVLLPRGCRTTSGQKVTVKITGSKKSLRRIDITRRKGVVSVRTSGRKVKLRVVYQAPATRDFAALSLRKVYRT